MQAAQMLAGYSLGEADLLRRAMGKKIRKEMEAQRKRFVVGRGRARRRARPGRCDLRTARAVRRIRLQQEPRRGLRAGRLSDRLYEGELSGRVPRRVDDARHGQYRQARGIPRRGGAARHQGRAAVGQSLGRRIRGRDGNTIIYALAALKGVGAQAVESIVAARGERAIRRSSPISPHASIRARSTSACWKAWRRPARSMRSKRNRARAFAAVDAMLGARAAQPRDGGGRAERNVRRRARRASALVAAGGRALAAGRAAATRIRRGRVSSSPAIRSTITPPLLKRTARAVLGGVLARGEERARRRAASPRTVVSRHGAAHQDRQQDGHHRPVRSDRAVRGGRCSAEGLAQYRDLLEPGNAVLLFLAAEVQGDDVRARIQSAEPLDEAAAKLQKGLRVFLRDAAPLEARQPSGWSRVGAAAHRQGDGEVSVVLMLETAPRSRSGCPAASRSRRRSPAPSRRCRASCRSRRCTEPEACAVAASALPLPASAPI